MIRFPVSGTEPTRRVLHVYLLGTVDFDAALRFQRRLHSVVCENRNHGVLVLCEHPALISVGRQGSHSHIRSEGIGLPTAHVPVRWVSRGGGCILHQPGQLAVYPILSLQPLGLDVATYLRRLGDVTVGLGVDLHLGKAICADDFGGWAGDRLFAAFGVAVRDWVSSFGMYVNVHPSLAPYRLVRTIPAREPMTSLEREKCGPVRPSFVRQRLIDHFQARFAFDQVALFTDHPMLAGEVDRSTNRRATTPCAR